ncbi:caspase family protein [Ideonella azotifigens]|uniref:Caspase family protein n=1 Tax=Ideonella azotifigens TaxID=513160 RepID=A0ABP3VQ07_9BURK|nr:caspase family protein [Ideonella azotifigens]MCD2340373.1 caspase family protein [Ideonella azotifigens]
MRVLLAIGCNEYNEAGPLTGAEPDAQRIFDALVSAKSPWYDGGRSRLLRSPTLDDVRAVLRDMLFKGPEIETFTFFFAGHGGVHAGSFYMWLKDTMKAAQSVSALALADLFRSINEAAPRQTNIIIDACESGGLVDDLGVLLKPELLGDVGTPALTLVATSGRNQYAGETAAGGLGTNALLDCIEGREVINDTVSALDLVDIGRRVAAKLQPEGQNPVVWGLNLYGPPSFCRNPRFSNDGLERMRDFVQTWPTQTDDIVKANQDALWTTYLSVSGDWSQKRFQRLVWSIVQAPNLPSDQIATVIERLAAAFLQRAAQCEDPYRSVLAAAILAASLLPHVENPAAHAVAERLTGEVAKALLDANARLISSLSADRFALLSSRNGGLADLYFLPLRVSQALGWAAAGPYVARTEEQRAQAVDQIKVLLPLILEHYERSLVALNDSQASAWCICLAQASEVGLMDEGERLAGLLFYSLAASGGRVARGDLPAEDALAYLLAKMSGDYSGVAELIERPMATIAVLLKAARLFDLDEVFDEALWRLDGVSLSAYMPANLAHFNDEVMRGGENVVWAIGRDVFRTTDFLATWPSMMPAPATAVTKALSVLAALTLPDRQPWFLLDATTSDERPLQG